MEKSSLRKFNLIFPFILAGFFFFYSLLKGEIITGILLAYLYWSWWWGGQLLWPLYIGSIKYERDTIDAFLMKVWLPVFYFPFYLVFSGIVGVLGGGIYKFFKYINEDTSDFRNAPQELSSENWETVNEAAIKLGVIAKNSPVTIEPLISGLIKNFYSREPRVASGAALAISKICEANPDILTRSWADLSQFLNYTDSTKDYEIIAKRSAVYVLGRIGQTDMSGITISIVSRYLNDQDEQVKSNAIEGIKLLNQSFINNKSLK